MKVLKQSFLMMALMMILTGLIYPLLVTAVAQGFFSHEAGGQIVSRQGQPVASVLLAQKITSTKYFWPRPSAADYNASSSSGSNLGPLSQDLKKQYDERRAALMAAHPDQGEPPQDLLFASASGLDPEISVAAAQYQVNRVAKARNFDNDQRQRLQDLVARNTAKAFLGIIGEDRVNVMTLNIQLDE